MSGGKKLAQALSSAIAEAKVIEALKALAKGALFGIFASVILLVASKFILIPMTKWALAGLLEWK